MNSQLQFTLLPDWQTCPHRSTFYTLACVPGGNYCHDCKTLLDQSLPVTPEACGYITADWQHHLDTKPWTALP